MAQHPTTIGRYVIEAVLGQGGWGIVYRAHDPELNRLVALKYIPLTDDAQRKRWRREARTAANLSHPHIVLIHDAAQTDDAFYIVMELLTGGTLRQRLTAPVAWPASVSLLLPLCDALAYAHQQGIIHRDIKPENILFSATDEIKLVDFGLAYLVGASRLTRGSELVVGTPCYAAPEQIKGAPVDGRVDIFALATVLYETVTGQPLFTGDNYQMIYQKIVRAEPVDLSLLSGMVPASLLQSLAQALAKNPADRYATADAFGVALRRCLEDSPAPTTVKPPSGDIPTRSIIQTKKETPFRIKWPIGVLHTLEEDALLGQLYQDESPQVAPEAADHAISRVLVKEELPGGFGGARILVVIPIEQNDTPQAARVVKLGPRVMLEAERDNYDHFVRERLPTTVASRKRFAAQETLAALEYVFVGGGLLEPVCDLRTYYQEHTDREIVKTLQALLADHLGQYWYRHGRSFEEYTATEYGPHLPAHVNLELRPEMEDRLWPESEAAPHCRGTYHSLDVETLLFSQDPAAPGEAVEIRGLEVVRIKPWAATLAASQERRVRVRVEYDPESGIAEQLQPGQRVAVRGRVITTRHGLLETIVQVAFNQDNEINVSPADDRVLAGLGRGPYPNPLKLYPALLDEILAGYRSVIHGDLHLRNILVDRDGRPWLIDFGRVREGHTLFDFIKLETYVRLDILSQASSFSLVEYARFEEALADAHYGLWAAGVPTNRKLKKAFRVIRAIRRLAGRFHPSQASAEPYFRCLLLFNLAVLKYAREAILTRDDNDKEQDHQLQAARLSFITAAVQGRWLESPPRPRPRLPGILEQWRESLTEWSTRLTKPALSLAIIIVLVILLGSGYSVYRFWQTTRRAQAENLNSQCAVYIQQGNLKTAEGLCWQAIQADPKYPTAHHNLGMVYFVQKDLEQAMAQFQAAIALDPSYASPHHALGRVYDDQGRVEEALSELRRAIELDPGISEAYSEIGYILNRQERYAEAVNILQEGLEKGEARNPPYLLKNLGRAYLGLGEPDQAVEYLEIAATRLSRDDPLYIETHRLLAEAYEAQGDFDKALEEWQGPLEDESDAPKNIQRLLSIIGAANQPNGGENNA